MKNVTIAKDFKFNGSKLTLEYKKEVLYRFKSNTVLDTYNIESCIYKLKNAFVASDKNKFKEVVNHTIKYDINGFIITLDSMFERETYPKTHEVYFATLLPNSVQLI